MSTRDQILEIAYRAFAEKGYNHTSMGAIAEELGITRPALYYHFSSKEDLLLATYEMIDPLINVSADEAIGAVSADMDIDAAKQYLRIFIYGIGDIMLRGCKINMKATRDMALKAIFG